MVSDEITIKQPPTAIGKLTRIMTIAENLQTIGDDIRSSEIKYQRPTGSVHLLAVSKRHPVAAIKEAYTTGQRAFGENYAQEMAEKAQQLAELDIDWHFIGPIQSNKTRQIAEVAHWVHSVDRLKIAQRLSDQKPADKSAINICLQVNISREASKSGVLPEEAAAIAQQIAQLPGIKLRGLMAIPAAETDIEKQRAVFAELRHLQQELNTTGLGLDTLSIGMSDDMEAAIAEGSTIVRIGTAIFGSRSS